MFLKNWFHLTRQKIKNGEIDLNNFNSEVEQLALELLKIDLIGLIANHEIGGKIASLKRNEINIGGVKIGGNNIIAVQSMAINSLQKIDALYHEFKALANAGSEIIRIAVTGQNDASNMRLLKEKLHGTSYDKIPIVMCGQYNIAPIIKETDILDHISKLRINPGNISLHSKNDDNFVASIKYLIEYNQKLTERPKICIRIGVNWGSLDEKLKTRIMDMNHFLPEPRSAKDVEKITLAISAISSGLYAELLGFDSNLIIVSCKTSEVFDSYIVNKILSILCDYPIHLGITEAGQGEEGVILTACGLAPILLEGIGNTVRVSITPKLSESRIREVQVCKQILQSVGIRQFKPKITSCPGCGRTDSNYFRELTEKVQIYVEKYTEFWCVKYQNEEIRALKVAVMGCLVNGPGESKHADIGISLPGFRESHSAIVYLNGEKYKVIKESNIEEEFFKIINEYIDGRYK